MKYKIGDFVSKPVTGICKIEDIVSMDLTGKKDLHRGKNAQQQMQDTFR